jgi:hypothetical protein
MTSDSKFLEILYATLEFIIAPAAALFLITRLPAIRRSKSKLVRALWLIPIACILWFAIYLVCFCLASIIYDSVTDAERLPTPLWLKALRVVLVVPIPLFTTWVLVRRVRP